MLSICNKHDSYLQEGCKWFDIFFLKPLGAVGESVPLYILTFVIAASTRILLVDGSGPPARTRKVHPVCWFKSLRMASTNIFSNLIFLNNNCEAMVLSKLEENTNAAYDTGVGFNSVFPACFLHTHSFSFFDWSQKCSCTLGGLAIDFSAVFCLMTLMNLFFGTAFS